jgi:nickel-dependent lactate racemase
MGGFVMNIKLPYGKGFVDCSLPDEKVKAVVENQIHKMKATGSEEDLVHKALENPIDAIRLCEMGKLARRAIVITSDHTRPVPSKITLPILLAELRRHNSALAVTILVATGAHRASTKEELVDKFGSGIVANEKIVMHNAMDDSAMIYKGKMPSDKNLYVNKIIEEADLIVAEGFIEPHFFAGFSGGRKSILPGICSIKTVMVNHCAALIADPHSRTGILKANPIHADMVAAARICNLRFILNVVIDQDKKIVGAFAGHPEHAHEAGCAFVGEAMRVATQPADIVITTNGGYPLDQNIYQAVKGMTGAESFVREGGVIIILSRCEDGHGGEIFYKWFKEASSPREVADKIAATAESDTIPDQWQAQILARVLLKSRVIMVAEENCRDMINHMHMTYAATLKEAISLAEKLKPGHDGFLILPDGVSVIPEAGA